MLPWRWLAVVGEGPALVMIVLLVFMPRSPRRLLSLGQEDKAKKVLLWLRGEHYNTHTEVLAIQVDGKIAETCSRPHTIPYPSVD